MTVPELVQRVKYLKPSEASTQVEKFVIELLGPEKRGHLMEALYIRRVKKELKRRTEE